MKFPFAALLVTLLALAIGCTTETADTTTPDNAASSSAPSSAPTADDQPTNDTPSEAATQVAPDGANTETKDVSSAPVGLPDGALTIGSKAPALDIEHWVSDGNGAFQAITEFAADKVYVVEFWATWCGPCVNSMPHLAELQEQYKDSVQIISISDEDLDTVNGFLERPYSSEDAEGPKTYAELTSAYCLTTDPDRSTGQAYMEAAGQNGIPACFLVGKTGLIEWIGHPMRLDQVLPQVIEGSWDRDAFASEFKKSQIFGVMMMQIFEAAQSGDLAKAEQLIGAAKQAASGPREKMQIQQIEMQVKMAPIAQKMQSGDIKGAIADLETLLESADGQAKQQLATILARLKEDAAIMTGGSEESEVVEPAEDDGA